MRKKKKLYIAISIIAGSLILLGVATLVLFKTHILCIHKWQDATCDKPVNCSICERTVGNPVGHHWMDATCTTAKTCDICGMTDGEALGHIWTEATCTEAKACSVCGAIEGEALGHTWVAATYSAPKTCSVCGKTEGSALVKPSTTTTNSSSTTNTTSNNNSASTKKFCVICNNTITDSNPFYCDSHDCAHSDCFLPAKFHYGYGAYCEIHSCRYYNCTNTPVGGNSGGYCSAHQYIWENSKK